MVVKPSSHVALRRKISLNWVVRSANAHWATPPFSVRWYGLGMPVRVSNWGERDLVDHINGRAVVECQNGSVPEWLKCARRPEMARAPIKLT